jgi:ATP-dependent exoDNAse (exonuclease V) beta subunit
MEFSSEGPTSKISLPEGVYLEDGKDYMKIPIEARSREKDVIIVDRSRALKEAPKLERTSPTEMVKVPPELAGEGIPELGVIMHEVLDMISKNRLTREKVEEFLESRTHSSRVRNEVRKHLGVMRKAGFLEEYVVPDNRESYSELPFAMKEGRAVVSGRIDRVILERDRALIIDYKTHSGDHEAIKKVYQPQIEYYKKAVDAIFEPRNIRAYILLTGSGEVIKI